MLLLNETLDIFKHQYILNCKQQECFVYYGDMHCKEMPP